jgi:hypothetical protein
MHKKGEEEADGDEYEKQERSPGAVHLPIWMSYGSENGFIFSSHNSSSYSIMSPTMPSAPQYYLLHPETSFLLLACVV